VDLRRNPSTSEIVGKGKLGPWECLKWKGRKLREVSARACLLGDVGSEIIN
jgi:hypothetical protein